MPAISGVQMPIRCLIAVFFLFHAAVAPALADAAPSLPPVAQHPVSSKPMVLPKATELPVGPAGTWRSPVSNGVDRQIAVLSAPAGGFKVVYAQYLRGDMDSSRLMQIRSSDGRLMDQPEPLSFGSVLEDAPVLVHIDNDAWLYFAGSDADFSNITLWRARATPQGFGAPQRLPDVPGLTQLVQAPRWVQAEGDLYLTFRGMGTGPRWMSMRNARSPSEFQGAASTPVAYPRVVPLGQHGCFMSYQKAPEGGYMTTLYSVSPDCRTWSGPVELSPAKSPNKPDVHDAFALPRQDGGVDIYYVYPSYKGATARFPVSFDLYRRAVDVQGRAGPEQLLTERLAYNPFAPSAHRMPDGSVLVSFSDIEARGDAGVTKGRLTLFRISGDAPMEPERPGHRDSDS